MNNSFIKKITENEYSYLKYDDFIKLIYELFQKKEYLQIYKIFTNQTPIWVGDKKEFEAKKDMLFLKKHIGKHLIIEKELARYFENVVYIGSTPSQGVNLQIIYDVRYSNYDNWSDKKTLLNVETYQENKLYFDADLEKLKLCNLGVKKNEKNIYLEVKNYVLQEIRARILKKPYNQEWKEFLKFSGVEYILILQKAQKFIDNFFSIYSLEYECLFDYYIDQELKIDFMQQMPEGFKIIDCYWTMPNNIYSSYRAQSVLKNLHFKLSEYFIISASQVTQLDLEKLGKSEIKEQNYKKDENNVLYYWNKEVDYKINN